MDDTIIQTVFGLLDAYLGTDIGHLIAYVILLGVIIALLRMLEYGAGGRKV